MSCAIFLNGEYEDEEFYLRQFAVAQVVVAADGGHAFLRRGQLDDEVIRLKADDFTTYGARGTPFCAAAASGRGC